MPIVISFWGYIQTIYRYYLVSRHVESRIGFAMSGEAAILRKNQNASEGSGTVAVPTVDKRRVIPIDAGCKQRNKKIQIQEQNTFQKISEIVDQSEGQGDIPRCLHHGPTWMELVTDQSGIAMSSKPALKQDNCADTQEGG